MPCNTSHPRGCPKHKNRATSHRTCSGCHNNPSCAASVGCQSRSGITSIPSVLSSPGDCVPVHRPPPSRLTLTPRGSRSRSRVPLNLDPSDHFQQNMVPWMLWGGVSHKHAHMLIGSLIVKTDKCVSLVQNLRTLILSIHLWIIQRSQWCAGFSNLIYFLQSITYSGLLFDSLSSENPH